MDLPGGLGRVVVPAGARTSGRVVTSGGRRRAVLVVEPAARGADPLPCYVVLHGAGATPAQEAQRTGLVPLAAAGRAVLVYPRGRYRSWNAGQGCCGGAGRRGVDDVGWVRSVVDDAVAHLGVSPSRVHLVGYSNGGKLALRLAAAEPCRWAGVAVYAAVPLVPVEAEPPVPLLLAGGTADPVTPWAGPPQVQNGALAPSVSGAADRYLDGLGLGGARPEEERLAGGRVSVRTWRGAEPREVVRLVGYEGRGHDWPQAGDAPVPLAGLIESFFAGA